MSEDNKRLAILDELDKFNTAPQADSLMLGILQEEEASRGRLNLQNEDVPLQDPADPAQEEKPGTSVPDNYLPLNTSIQELQGKFDSRISGLERSIQSLVNTQSQVRQPVQQQQQQPNYDPDMPVTAHHLMQLAERQEMAYNMSMKAYKNNISTRAHLELQRFQAKNPDYQLDPVEVDNAINQMERDGNLSQLEKTNWQGYFQADYAPQRETRYQDQSKQIEKLQKELESLKKNSARSTQPTQPVSPSTGRSSRSPAAISTPLTQSSEDEIVGLKSFRQKGNFKGFANDIKSIGRRQAGA